MIRHMGRIHPEEKIDEIKQYEVVQSASLFLIFNFKLFINHFTFPLITYRCFLTYLPFFGLLIKLRPDPT